MPMKAVVGLGISAVLLITAIGLELYGYRQQQGIITREVADPAGEPLLEALPEGTVLPTPELQPAMPTAPPFAGLRNSGLPPGHPGGDGGAGTGAGAGDPGGGAAAGAAGLAARGRAVALKLKCLTCHTEDGRPSVSSSFFQLYGKQSVLMDGSRVTVDEAYLRESILDPQAKVVKGPTVPMPAYKGSIGDADLDALVAYIKSLSAAGK